MKTVRVRNLVIGEGAVKVCIPLVAGAREQLLTEAKEVAVMEPDLIEWRVDYCRGAEDTGFVLEALARLREIIGNIPLIFTFRVDREGGGCSIPDPVRFQIMKAAMHTKLTDLLDIELITEKNDLNSLRTCAEENGVGIIISNHDFQKTPTVQDMVNRLRQAQDMGADIAKLAVMPVQAADVLDLLYAACLFKEMHGAIPLIAVSMSQMGLVSRAAGGVFGSDVTFAAGQRSSAPGQIEAGKLRSMLESFG